MAQPRIIVSATAELPYCFSQPVLLAKLCEVVFGPDWKTGVETSERISLVSRLFTSSGVEYRGSAVDLLTYYDVPHSTADRMAEFRRTAYPLARAALTQCLARAGNVGADAITDFLVVSCTGYHAPGPDLVLARDLGMPADVRRVVIGHMGCYGALVGLRQALAVLRAQTNGLVALLSVELASLHYASTDDLEVLTSYALFGDGIAAVLLGTQPEAPGPELVDTHCLSDFGAMGQMSWTITDEGFMMGLSPRVPITLRRNVVAGVQRLLAPHGLSIGDVSHWLIHPGGPSVLEVMQDKLGISDEQMALSWQTLRDHGNCSSATVLIMLDTLLRSGATRRGEWGVMMAFGPGLTLEMALLRF
jgi:alkylresorcinol/alkylpyrone synthase